MAVPAGSGSDRKSAPDRLRSLQMPPDEYRLDLILKPDTHPRTDRPRAGFETVAECQAEDLSRALALRATAHAIIAISNGIRPTPANSPLTRLNIDPQAAVNLADRLQAGAESGRPQPTLASALCMREARLWFAGTLLEVIDNNPDADTRLFTAIWSRLGSRPARATANAALRLWSSDASTQ